MVKGIAMSLFDVLLGISKLKRNTAALISADLISMALLLLARVLAARVEGLPCVAHNWPSQA